MTQEALKLALDYLESRGLAWNVQIALREALREHAMREVQRLGQEIEQEPCDMGEMCLGCSPRRADGSCPDAKPWVGLTDEEYDEIWRMDLNNKDIMDKTIAKLKEKNT